MKLRVSHLTRYEYAQTVSFSPHVVYVRPRESPLHHLTRFSFNISPNAKVTYTRDVQDNVLTWIHFWDRSNAMSIRVDFEVETLDTNPFDFILRTAAVNFPFHYDPIERFALGPYLAPPFSDTQRRLTHWLDEHYVDRPKETVPFITGLNEVVFETLRYTRRPEGGIQPSATTCDLGTGSCRDYAVLFIELCRMLGLAARFVSGYLYAADGDDHRSVGAMHAWAEVYLPGAGWKGFDPTHGVLCGEAFIPVAHAAQAESVNPFQGSYYSPIHVPAELTAHLLVEKLKD